MGIKTEITSIFNKADMIGVVCDLTKSDDIKNAVAVGVKSFGGIDIV